VANAGSKRRAAVRVEISGADDNQVDIRGHGCAEHLLMDTAVADLRDDSLAESDCLAH
jgi:hypothetical protein